MKKVKRGLLRRYNSLIAWVLSAFGIACSNIACEYGTPEAKFNVSGTIQSEAMNEPIENIRVIMGYDTAYSDATGLYKVSVNDFPVSQSFDMSLTDIDGAANGEFQPLDTVVSFTDPEFHDGSGNWYQGETEKVINFKLRK